MIFKCVWSSYVCSSDLSKCYSLRSSRCQLKLRTAIDGNTGSCNPSRTIGCHKSDYVGNILGFAESLQRLHSQCDFATRFGLREIRHIGVDDAGSNSVYAYAARPKKSGPVLDQSLKRSFSRGV